MMCKASSTWKAVKSSCFPWLKKITDWLALWASKKGPWHYKSKETTQLNDEEQNYYDIDVHLYRWADSSFEMGMVFRLPPLKMLRLFIGLTEMK